MIDGRAEIPRGSRRAEAKITEDESHGSISNGIEARREIVERAVLSGWRTEHRCSVSHEDCRCRSPRGLAVPRQIEGRRSEEGGLNRAGQRVGHAKIFSLGRHCITYLLTYLLTRTGTRDFLRLTAKSIAPGHGEVLYLNIGVFFKALTSISTSLPFFPAFFLFLLFARRSRDSIIFFFLCFSLSFFLCFSGLV